MTTIVVKNADGSNFYLEGTGSGTSGDPFRPLGSNSGAALTALNSIVTQVGEVQASPTSNTLLDRLKQIYTALTGTLTVATHAVTQSGTWDVRNVSGTVSLPTGAATETSLTKMTASATLYHGTATLSTSAAAIGTTQACNGLYVQNDPDNTDDILVGDATNQTIQLVPGAAWPFLVNDVAKVYAKSVSGTPTLNWSARS